MIGNPKDLDSKHFNIRKLDWSVYELDSQDVKGVLKLLGVVVAVRESTRVETSQGLATAMSLEVNAISSFINEGERGEPDQSPFKPNEAILDDITDHLHPIDEPFNEFVIAGDPPKLLRTRTVATMVRVARNRYNAFGEPILITTNATTYSLGEFSLGNSLSV